MFSKNLRIQDNIHYILSGKKEARKWSAIPISMSYMQGSAETRNVKVICYSLPTLSWNFFFFFTRATYYFYHKNLINIKK